MVANLSCSWPAEQGKWLFYLVPIRSWEWPRVILGVRFVTYGQSFEACCTGVVLNTVRESATRLIVKKTTRLTTQAVVFFRRYFLCGALLCICLSAEREGLSTHVQREFSAEPFMRSILSQGIFTSLPGSRLRLFIAMQIQYSYYLAHLCTAVLIRHYAQNPLFEIVREESVKVYLHNKNVTGIFSRTLHDA